MSSGPETSDERVRALLRTRAERIRTAPAAEPEAALAWVAELPVGPDAYALPLDALRACVPLRAVTHVPLARPHVLGVLRFRGQTITALSLASLLGVRGWSVDPAVLVIVEVAPGHRVALDSEKVPRASGVPAAALAAARARAGGAIAEVALAEGRLLHVIDLARLLAEREGGGRHGA